MKSIKLLSVLTAAVVTMSVQANASFFDITFKGGGSEANGQIEVVGNDVIGGSLTITTGPNQGTYIFAPGAGSGPPFLTPPPPAAWVFRYDNKVYPDSHPFVSNDGLLFSTDGSAVASDNVTLINLFSTGADAYSLYGYPPSSYAPAVHNGTATLTPVPEPTTMIAGAFLLLPFGLSTLRIMRRKA